MLEPSSQCFPNPVIRTAVAPDWGCFPDSRRDEADVRNGTEIQDERGAEDPDRRTDGSPGAEVSDEVLVARARTGDQPAFGELTLRHRNACLRRAMLIIRDRGDAEDEVQNAFWKAYQRLDQYRGEGTFGAWFSRIVENQCLMRIREDRNVRYVYLDEPTKANVRLEVVGQGPDPENQLGLSEVTVLLRKEISRLPPLLRNVMLLRDLDQLSMSDVAGRLGLSIPAAKSRLKRARMELRARVSKHCGEKGFGTLTHTTKYSQAAYTRAP
jgi:RNA polymerase sigma-70 factor (ECF subfamily)